MSIFEYNKEEEEKKLRKAEYEAGEKSGIRNTARHLLELNLLSLENISRATGLSIDELKKLQQCRGNSNKLGKLMPRFITLTGNV